MNRTLTIEVYIAVSQSLTIQVCIAVGQSLTIQVYKVVSRSLTTQVYILDSSKSVANNTCMHISKSVAHLKVLHNLAHDAAEIPRLGDVTNDGGRQTDGDDEDVCEGQVDDEVVGHSAHVSVAPDGEADEGVADKTEEEDGGVEGDEDPFEGRGEDIRLYHVDVVIVAHAVRVVTLARGGRAVRPLSGPTPGDIVRRVHC